MTKRNSDAFLKNSCRRASLLQKASEQLARLFAQYDEDQDGMLTPKELKGMFCKELSQAGIRCQQKDFSRYEEIFDQDRNHQISLMEFQRIMIEYYKPIDR